LASGNGNNTIPARFTTNGTTDTVNGADTLVSIETILGGSGADSINAAANTLAGAAFRFDGGAGDDTLTGGSGADTLVGGAGTAPTPSTAARATTSCPSGRATTCWSAARATTRPISPPPPPA